MKKFQLPVGIVLGLISTVTFHSASAYLASDLAWVDYYGQNNNVTNTGEIGADAGVVSGTTAYGIQFTGSSASPASYNVLTNSGTIYSGTGASSMFSSGVYFNGTNNSEASYNTVTNNGTIIAQNGNAVQVGGILFNATNLVGYNSILNTGAITVNDVNGVFGIALTSGSDVNGNTVSNTGIISGTSSASSAYGVVLSTNGGSTNNNTISNSGQLTINAAQNAFGIYFLTSGSGTMTGNSILNSGTITVNAGYSATGIEVSSNYGYAVLQGFSIVNDGSIAVSGSNYGVGIAFYGGTDSSLVNRGNISASGAYVYGIDYEGYGGNTLTNYGTIVASGSYGATGAYFDGGDNLTLTNYGSITASSSYWATGVYFETGDNATLTNYGTITARDGLNWNAGVYFDGGNNATLTNYGTIAASGAYESYGVYFDASDNATLTNYGTITASGSNGSYGVYFSANDNATLTNFGTVMASGSSWAYGVYFDAGDNAAFTNYGTITASSSIYSTYGIDIEYATNSNLTNYGLIQANAGDGDATGIYAYGLETSTLTNYGTIVANGSGATGIYMEDSYGNNIVNWGTISAASTSGSGVAIYVQGDNNTITLAGHSITQGEISGDGDGNVLKLAFTGVSAKEKANLIAQINAITTSGTVTNGSFTFRGVTYTVDPLIVDVSTSSYKEQGKTPNQKAVGANLDSFSVNPTGDMLKMLNALDWSGNVPRGLEQLSPQRYQIYNDIALSNASLLVGLVDQRLDNVRAGSEAIDASALNVTYGSVQSKLGMGNSLAPVGTGKDSKEVITTVPGKRWGTFLSGNVGHASLDGTDDLQSSKFSDSGVIGGLDVKLTDAWTAGAMVGYAHTDADMDSNGSTADVDAYSAGLYSGYRNGGFYGNGLAAYTHNVYDSERVVDISNDYQRNAHSHTGGSQWSFNLDGGYNQPVTNWLSAGPFAGVQYVHLGVDSFTESHAKAASLNVDSMGMDSVRSRLGVRVELRKDLSKYWTLASELRAGWQHEFADSDRAIVAQFAGSGLGSFAVRTADPDRDRAVLGIGINATCSKTLTVFADYDAEVGTRYTEQILKGGFKLNF